MRMSDQLKERYGLFTAISMVVGIVIGSGVFFKAGKVLTNTGGSMSGALLTVAIVGLVMLICSYVFATLATRYKKINGIVDYAEASLGPRYGYYVAWFLTVIYYPTLTITLAWVSAQYTCLLFGFDVGGGAHVAIGALFLMCGFVLNTMSPRLAGKFQVSTTVIKLIPLCLMAVVGTIAGLVNGMTPAALSDASASASMVTGGGSMMGAIVAFSFSYEGWIIATSINAELKDPKKNLPRALLIGAGICIIVYLGYFVGITGSMTVDQMLNAGDMLPQIAFTNIFGDFVGSIIFVFIVISCLGTMNGLMMGCVRGAYTMAARGEGIRPQFFAHLDPETNMPHNSAILGLLLCAFWYAYWQICFWGGGVLGEINIPFFFNWEPDELPIITLYASYIPIFITMMRREKDLNTLQRYIAPGLGVIACCFMAFCAFYAYGAQAWYYLGFFAIVMVIGSFFTRKKA